jgi:hypothetical protein
MGCSRRWIERCALPVPSSEKGIPHSDWSLLMCFLCHPVVTLICKCWRRLAAATLFCGLPVAALAGPYAYVSNEGSASVSVIDTASDKRSSRRLPSAASRAASRSPLTGGASTSATRRRTPLSSTIPTSRRNSRRYRSASRRRRSICRRTAVHSPQRSRKTTRSRSSTQ